MTRSLTNPRGLSGPSGIMLDTTINTERSTKTVTKGDVVTTFAVNLTDVPASVQPGLSREAIRIGAERAEETYDIYVTAGVDITVGDTIVHGSNKYNVLGKRDMAGRGRAEHYIASRMPGVASA